MPVEIFSSSLAMFPNEYIVYIHIIHQLNVSALVHILKQVPVYVLYIKPISSYL